MSNRAAIMTVVARLLAGEHHMADESNALVPAEQSAVVIFGREVRAVRLSDGRIAAVFTDLCAALDLERAPQARRIRSDEVLSEQLLFAEGQTDAWAHPMDVLTAWAVPSWLQGMQASRLAPEKSPAILAFQRDASEGACTR